MGEPGYNICGAAIQVIADFLYAFLSGEEFPGISDTAHNCSQRNAKRSSRAPPVHDGTESMPHRDCRYIIYDDASPTWFFPDAFAL